ncbi:histidine phosphatase family protein [Actinophytocola oryzae]|uniref:Broad specificity phosphatase PhoE n=1 Tax=Actinophytocola oryzae TaxID=502181 RepID=A0A4R7V8X3_9PSEU|nr:histidine phosphatase family protein [Actinophytocola oryzae]TDV45363.1 broad specificity phosphatase PhoE [Actinophytocola oryzae]
MRIILLRHAESLGNIDELAYTRTPDHALPLTVRGETQAMAARPLVHGLVDGPLAAYVSPYVRAQRTYGLLDLSAERVVPEPRLREQDWGNLQDPVEQELEKQRRNDYGHFFYRLPHGESGADVDDRVASFLSELELRIAKDPAHPDTVLVVSHGLTMRLLCRRVFAWSIDLFESLSNPEHCAIRVLDNDGTGWRLNEPFAQWRDSPDGTKQL